MSRMPDQRSLMDQLEDLVRLANKEGMYDAADYLEARIQEHRARVNSWHTPVGDKSTT